MVENENFAWLLGTKNGCYGKKMVAMVTNISIFICISTVFTTSVAT